jgi:putative acetyltransferase
MTALVVRRETVGDGGPIRAVHRAAFAPGDGAPGGEPVEAGLVDALRADPGWLPHLSLVAVLDGELVGHVVATRATVDGAPALGVGPLGVLPGRQGRGVGTALMYALLGAAQARDETLVGLLGAPAYYGRFGFVAAADLGVWSPDPAWGPHFQALALARPTPVGAFRYAAPFAGLG